ncbi:MAG: glutamate synthase subunit alpha, partial [Clostridiales Family XIII bacterium]|nr:glutamate synthase subunit alpha [Clostridiales Family XIII bacterium]
MSDYQFQPMKLGMYDSRFERDACGIGMLVNIEGKQSHGLVDDAIEVLINMTHRGGVGAEPETGDGAGIMTQIPHNFFKRVMECMDVELPEPGEYAIAMMFGSPEQKGLQMTTERFVGVFEDENLEVLGVRSVPVHYDFIGDTARKLCPGIRQIFIKKPAEMTEIEFERKLYIVSKLAHNAIRPKDVYFYLSSISSRTIVYKGMLRPDQLSGFYLDLQDVDFASAIALVHSRFSTNTFPSWERAHPMSYIIHNGEINTIRGNVNWVRAREASFKSDYFGEELERVFPVINEEGSDSAMLDDFVKLLVHSGYSLPQAVMMAVPEPWENNADMDDTKKAFYEFNSTLMEPWDGPAAIAFTDGKIAGATLDRNGLRPSRYYLMDDNTLILASEVGVLKLPQERVVKKDRLRPGRMLLIDTEEGRIIEDKELKHNIATALPYREWLDQYLTELDNLHFSDKIGISWSDVVTGIKSGSDNPKEQALLKTISSLEVSNVTSASGFYTDEFNLVQEQKLFGYTYEDINLTLKEIAEKHDDPISSMGIDTPLAVLSNKPQLLYNYFKQLFAQVTNPPIDAIREKIVTSSNIQLGTEGNLLEPAAVRCQMIRHSTPILTIDDLSKLKGIDLDGYQSVTLPITFKRRKEDALKKALDDLFIAAEIVMEQGYNILILSDLGADEENVPIPALLATSALHHYLVKNGTRTKVSLVVETGEAREAHHMATLVGYGANAVCPVLAYKSLESMADTGWIDVDKKTALRNYQQTMTKAIVKIMSKMGISTVRSYHGAQVFEALGVSEACVEEYFTGTISRIEGIELTEMEQEARARHRNAFDNKNDDGTLDPGGDYKWRKDGEYHLFNPENIYYLQQSCRTGNYDMFKTFSKLVNKRTVELKNIRGLLEIVEADKPISIETVESAESIVKRFKTGAMSYGSISKKAHETMAIAMNRLGAKSNTGEGGEESERFTPDANGDNRCSAIKQVASGRFGVTIDYLNNAKEIQIKMAQGAKPGEGGHLPGMKVYPWIAKSRYSTPGVELISPPPHHDIYSIEDLAQLIRDLKSANPDARISVKLVSEGGVGTIAVGVSKALADVIVVSGYDGGTGAAPRTSVRHAGLPWELGVAEAHQSLLMNNMRNRVVL